MRLPLEWLKEYVVVKEKPAEAAEIFTVLGFEVEKIDSFGGNWESICAAKITAIRPHPSADRLHLVIVEDGRASFEVVCGASNIKVGQHVPFAREGVVLPTGLTITRRAIRGVESRGMLCSAKELGLGADESGILILPNTAKPGKSLTQALGLSDVVFDITVPPNRPDCFSVIGLAREYAAYTNRRTIFRKNPAIKAIVSRKMPSVKIKIVDTTLCSVYTARIITDIKVAESPMWLKKRLLAAGLRPINNVVDATNYIMLETGYPLHAFDIDKLKIKNNSLAINVRPARSGENIITLDGAQRALNEKTLVISDAQQPMAVAGVMGGQVSEVTSKTTRLLLEAAVFNPRAVRQSGQRLGLRSESSTRFEKGLSESGLLDASGRATRLIGDLTHGQAAKITLAKGKKAQPPKPVFAQPSEISALLGQPLSIAQIRIYLERAGCRVAISKQRLRITPPAWRTDIAYQADIVEEIGRLFGYNKLQPTLPVSRLNPVGQSEERQKQDDIRDRLVQLGFTEVYTHSFYSREQAGTTEVPLADHYYLTNPLNKDQQYLRTSLWPRMKEVIRKNSFNIGTGNIFEIGRVFLPGKYEPMEKTHLGAVLVRKKTTPEGLLRELKGVLESLWSVCAIDLEPTYKTNGVKSAIILPPDQRVGYFAILPASVAQELKIDGAIGYINIDLPALPFGRSNYNHYSAYPIIERDLAVIVTEETPFSEIRKIIDDQNVRTRSSDETGGLIRQVTLFDEVYRGPNIGSGKKSLPIRIIYQSQQRTLRREEVDKIQKTIIDILSKQLQANVRGASD